jgi:ribosome maturation protein SDO1
MSGKIFTPVNQVRFTNVAVVRLQRSGKRFEIACYKNKVIEWRKKITTDLDEVLQTPTIFTNVGKGVIAKKAELSKAFNTTDQEKIIQMILDKGEIQVSTEERKLQLDNSFKDIAQIVVEKCINPETGRPLTVGMVEKAMKDIHYSVKAGKSPKQQALDVIRLLREKSDFPIARAPMRMKMILPEGDLDKVKTELKDEIQKIEREDKSGERREVVILIDPSNFRFVEETIKKQTNEAGAVEVLTLIVHSEGESNIE